MMRTMKFWVVLLTPWCNYWQLYWLQFIAAAYTAYSAKRAGDKAEGLGNRGSSLEAAETAESIRRKKAEMRDVLGLTRASTLANYIELGKGGTADIYLDTMKKEYEKDIQWIRIAGASRAKERLAEGGLARRQAYSQAVGYGAAAVKSVGSGNFSQWWG